MAWRGGEGRAVAAMSRRTESAWDAGRILATALHHETTWTAPIAVPELTSALDATAEGLEGDITIAGQSVPVRLNGDEVQISIGPFLVTGTIDAWHKMLDSERPDARPLSQFPRVAAQPWQEDVVPFPVTSVE